MTAPATAGYRAHCPDCQGLGRISLASPVFPHEPIGALRVILEPGHWYRTDDPRSDTFRAPWTPYDGPALYTFVPKPGDWWLRGVGTCPTCKDAAPQEPTP